MSEVISLAFKDFPWWSQEIIHFLLEFLNWLTQFPCNSARFFSFDHLLQNIFRFTPYSVSLFKQVAITRVCHLVHKFLEFVVYRHKIDFRSAIIANFGRSIYARKPDKSMAWGALQILRVCTLAIWAVHSFPDEDWENIMRLILLKTEVFVLITDRMSLDIG